MSEELQPAEGAVTDEGGQPPVDDQQQDNGEGSPYAPLAKDMGWTPRDQFQGDPTQWKDAETFIRDGRDIQRETASRLKSVQTQLDTLARTSASIVEQTVNERLAALQSKHAEAVDAGDTDEALRIAGQITTTKAKITAPVASPPPEAQAFAERNAAWFRKPGNEYATSRAIEISNTLAAQGYTDTEAQLRIVEQRMRQEFPNLFGQQQNGKPAPGVNAPGTRTAAPGNRQKGFADMPLEAQNIARDMVERKVIKSTDDYVRNFFASQAGKA